jgi:hypothetical protein
MVWGGGGWSRWTTPLGLLLLVSVASPAPFKEEWPENWPEATDLAFPEEGIQTQAFDLYTYTQRLNSHVFCYTVPKAMQEFIVNNQM